MKRLFIVTLAVVLGFSTGMAAKASADSIQGKSAVGVNLMYVMPASTDVSFIDPETGISSTSSVSPDSAVGFGLSYTYGLTKDWALELTLDRSAHDFKDAEMEIALTTLSVTGQYRPEIGSLELSPYVGLGLGYSLNSVELTSNFKDFCDFLDLSCKTSIGNSLTLHLNAGADYFINDNIALFGEGRYTISSASFDFEIAAASGETATVSGDLNLDRFDIRAGVKYYF